jgi:hypothetical protein
MLGLTNSEDAGYSVLIVDAECNATVPTENADAILFVPHAVLLDDFCPSFWTTCLAQTTNDDGVEMEEDSCSHATIRLCAKDLCITTFLRWLQLQTACRAFELHCYCDTTSSITVRHSTAMAVL